MQVFVPQSKRLTSGNLSIVPFVIIALLSAVIPGAASADEMSDFRRAKAAVSSGDLLEAQGLLEDFIDDYPYGRNTLKAKYLLGHLLYRRADYSAAAAVFAGIVDDHPAWEYADRAAYGLAVAQCGTLDYAGAVRTLEMLLDTYPESEILDDSLYWLGEAYYRRGDYARALERFNEFLDDYPNHPLKENALNSVAWCLEELGRYSEAVTSRERFLREFPDGTLRERVEFHLATDYLKVGDPRAAIEHYLLSEAAAPSTPLGNQALFRAGVLLSESGKRAESIQVLEKLLMKNPAAEIMRPARLALGYCYLTTGEYGKAETVFRAHLKATGGVSQNCAATFQLALAQTAQGNFSDAASNLSKIVRQSSCDPLGDAPVLVLSACYLKLDQPAAAANVLRSHLITRDVSRRSPELLFTYAGSLVLANRFSEALPILTELSRDEFTVEEFPQILYYEALCSLRESQYVRASEKFAQCIEHGGPDALAPLAAYLRAYSLLKAQSLAEAGASYQNFVGKYPNHVFVVSALYQSGAVNLMAGKYDDAASSLERVLHLLPNFLTATPARYLLGLSWLRQGKFAGAGEMFRSVLSEAPDFGLADRAMLAWGWAEFAHGNYGVAEELFQRIPSRFPDTTFADSSLFFAAAARYKRGMLGAAATEFQRVPKLFPDSPLAPEALMWAGLCEEKLNHPANAAALYGGSLQEGGSKQTRALARYGIAWSKMRLMDLDAAGRAFGDALEEAPLQDMAEQAYFWRGRLDYAAGKWAGAQENLLKLAGISPASALADHALFFAARAARNSSELQRAIELFRELGKRFPQSSLVEQADIEAAQCMIEAGRAEEAARTFEDFIKNNVGSPLRPVALYDMGRALQRAGKFEQAIEQYRAAEGGERTELAARARFAIAECLTELDRGSEAIAELTSITRGGYSVGWAERAQLQMARLLERNGQKEEARHIYLAVSETYRDGAAGIVAQRALARLESERTPALIR